MQNVRVANVYKQGEHICSLYDTEAEQLAAAAEYLSDGLRRAERCIYVAQSAAALQRFRAALDGVGIDATYAVRAGALLQLTHSEAHLAGGRFDSERMLDLLNNAVESALNNGFNGLRTCGDMSWLLVECDGREQNREYEALLNQFFRDSRAAGMCQYDRRRLELQRINDALATHSSTVLNGRHQRNPLYKPIEDRGKRSQQRS